MTDLLDSVYKQYPVGSLLVWETDQPIATLDELGPFIFPQPSGGAIGYLLDGHQRLSTIAGALVARDTQTMSPEERDPARWDLVWNMEAKRFQHGRAEDNPGTLFPLASLLDTLKFFDAIKVLHGALSHDPNLADGYTSEVSELAKAFQSYRVPVIRIRQTGLSEAVEIFARLNSKGQAMSLDQMVSALMYRQEDSSSHFDLASEIDVISDRLGQEDFGDIDRATILRAILANLDEDIYRTDWTRLTRQRREDFLKRLRAGVARTEKSMDLAVSFLKSSGVRASRLLPYTMQLLVLSSFFDIQPTPTQSQIKFLRHWFWVSSFSGWFGAANTARVNSLVTEFRRVAGLTHGEPPDELTNFDLRAKSLPFPTSFDMRSARTRALLLVMLSLQPRKPDGEIISDPWRMIAEQGPSAVGYVFGNPPREWVGNPANRMIRPPDAAQGLLYSWIERNFHSASDEVLYSHGLNRTMLTHLQESDAGEFIGARQKLLIQAEHKFLKKVGVAPSDVAVANAPIDTE
jgi:hypothetical protein